MRAHHPWNCPADGFLPPSDGECQHCENIMESRQAAGLPNEPVWPRSGDTDTAVARMWAIVTTMGLMPSFLEGSE